MIRDTLARSSRWEESAAVSNDLEHDVFHALQEWDDWLRTPRPNIAKGYAEGELVLHLHVRHFKVVAAGNNLNATKGCCVVMAQHDGGVARDSRAKSSHAFGGDLDVPFLDADATQNEQEAVFVDVIQVVQDSKGVRGERSIPSIARLQPHDVCCCSIGDALYFSAINGFVFPGVGADGKLTAPEGIGRINQKPQLSNGVVQAGAEKIQNLSNPNSDGCWWPTDRRIADEVIRRVRIGLDDQIVSVVFPKEVLTHCCEVDDVLFGPIDLSTRAF